LNSLDEEALQQELDLIMATEPTMMAAASPVTSSQAPTTPATVARTGLPTCDENTLPTAPTHLPKMGQQPPMAVDDDEIEAESSTPILA
jgi:hypothetical protein